MDSIFRERRSHKDEMELNPRPNYKNPNFKKVTHDNGILRARTYSLSSKLHFSEYSGSTIKELIEKNLNYFNWLPRNIEGFRYEKRVLEYAEDCLEFLERIDSYPETIRTELGKAINQVDAMIRYEDCLDFEDDLFLLEFYKSEINVNYYRKIVNTPTERLIRQAKEIEGNSSNYRREYFEEVKKKMNNLIF